MDVSILMIMSLTILLLYICLIDDHSIEGAPYFPSMEIISAWFEVSKAFNKSANSTHVGILWLCLRCRSVLILNVSS